MDQPASDETVVLVLGSSRATKHHVGAVAWIVLEDLALRARVQDGELLVDASARFVASDLGVNKDSVASAFNRLIALGLVSHRSRRRAGRYAGSVYVLDVVSCRRAGLLLSTADHPAAPYATTPGPAERDTARPGPVSPDTVPADMGDAASSNDPGGQADLFAQASLFSLPDEPAVIPAPEPTTPDDHDPTSNEPSHSNHHPPLPTTDPLPLTPSNRPDALAPEVRQGPVNVAGKEPGGRSGLNGNLNAELGSC